VGAFLNFFHATLFPQVPEIQSALPRVQGSIDAQRLGGGALAAALLGTTPTATSASPGGGNNVELTEEATNAVLGYPIDTFQVNCLKAIVQPGMDLMAMAVSQSTTDAAHSIFASYLNLFSLCLEYPFNISPHPLFVFL